jgi:hypothetical protein
MTTTSRTSRSASSPVKTPIRAPKRFLRCIACGTLKKERSYALCAECYRTNGTLSQSWFACFIRHAEREETQYSYRNDPRFEKACRVYARRRHRARAQAEMDAPLPRLSRSATDRRNRHSHDEYDGLGAYELIDLLDWQMHDVELPRPERPEHREMADAEIARWDARVDAWAEAHGLSLAEEPATEIRPWGYAMEIDGATVWTDDLVLD